MDLALQEVGSVTVVTLSGDLIIGDAEAHFKRTVSRLLEEGKVQIVVVCSGLRYVDSSGLGSLGAPSRLRRRKAAGRSSWASLRPCASFSN